MVFGVRRGGSFRSAARRFRQGARLVGRIAERRRRQDRAAARDLGRQGQTACQPGGGLRGGLGREVGDQSGPCFECGFPREEVMNASVDAPLFGTAPGRLAFEVETQRLDAVLVGILHLALMDHQARHEVVMECEIEGAAEPGDQDQGQDRRQGMHHDGSRRIGAHGRAARHREKVVRAG